MFADGSLLLHGGWIWGLQLSEVISALDNAIGNPEPFSEPCLYLGSFIFQSIWSWGLRVHDASLMRVSCITRHIHVPIQMSALLCHGVWTLCRSILQHRSRTESQCVRLILPSLFSGGGRAWSICVPYTGHMESAALTAA